MGIEYQGSSGYIKEGDAEVALLSADGRGGIVSSGGNSDVASKLLKYKFNAKMALRPCFDPKKPFLNVNATLARDEWKAFDDAALPALQERLIAVQDFLSRNMVYNIPNGLGTTVLLTQNLSDISDAEVTMNAATRGMRDTPVVGSNVLPLPIIFKDFTLDIRALEASRNGIMPLDTTMAMLAGEKVAQKVESITFKGHSSYTYGGGTIYGLEDFTYAVTGSLTAAWDSSAASASTILADVQAMKQALLDKKHYGPFGVYVPASYETTLDDDYSANYGGVTIRERLLKLDNIAFVRISPMMTQSKVVMVNLSPITMRMVIGMEPMVVEWDGTGGMEKHYKVMTIMVPQPRATQEGDCGIAVYSE